MELVVYVLLATSTALSIAATLIALRASKAARSALAAAKSASAELKALVEAAKLEAALSSKPLKKKKRYLVFRVISSKRIGTKALEEKVKKTFAALYGSPSLEESGLLLAYYDEGSGYGILRVFHAWKSKALLALSLIREVDGADALVVPLRATGTVKSAKELVMHAKNLAA